MTNEQSVELIYRISDWLNCEVAENGAIQINNKRIWKTILHQMNNTVWQGCLETLIQLESQHPELVNIDQLSVFHSAISIIKQYGYTNDNILDVKNHILNHKPIAWKCLMSMREIYNKC